MIKTIRSWIDHRNDRLRLEAMPDRLLADIGVERADIRQWLRGEKPEADETATPWTIRFRNATTAFARELRPNARGAALSH